MLSLSKRVCMILVLLLPVGITSNLHASFHFMQIEQVIAGVDGDSSAQAIQLRMRFVGQGLVSGVRLIAYDAQGLNPVVLITFPSNVINTAVGSRILVGTSSFAANLSPSITPDFIMANSIPPNYLQAGSLTFETSLGTIYWRLSWGGTNYTGSHAGSLTNDANGNFGPAWSGELPSSGTNALQFQGLVADPSVTNAADYSLTAGAAVFTNNGGSSGTVESAGPRPCPADCFNIDGSVDIQDLLGLLISWGDVGASCDIAGDNTVSIVDLLELLTSWGACP